MSNCCVLSYTPPRGVLYSESFVQNLFAYEPGLPMHVLSDDAGWNKDFIPCPDPGVMRHPQTRYRIANFIFLLALKVAIEKDYSHFIFLESDTRIRGDGWAWLMWQEMKSYPLAKILATPAAYNVRKIVDHTPKLLTDFISDYFLASGSVMSCYGQMPTVTVFGNGSLACYDTKLCHQIFRQLAFDDDLKSCAGVSSPFDVQIGRYLNTHYGIRMLDYFAPSALTYSSVDKIYDENARMNMLKTGGKSGVHPIKSAWNGLD